MNNVTPCALITQALLLGCFLAMSACTVIPVREREHIPARLPKQFAANGLNASNDRLSWQQSFPSEGLQADVQTLLDANFELEAARARVEQAAAAYGMARSALLPSLDGKADFDRSRIKEDGATDTQNTIAFEAALHWEVDIWGRLRARKEAAALSLEEQQALADQTTLDLQTLLVETWVTHHAARKLEQVLMKQRETNGQLLHLIECRLAYGQGNALDVLQQRGRLVTVERALPAVTSRKTRAANAYAVLMGRFPDGGNLPEDEWPTLKGLSALTTPHGLLMDRPDLKAALLALQAADHEVAAAIADRLPRLSLGLSYMESGRSLSAIGSESVFRFASGLLTPVFDGGQLKAKAAQRKAEARESLAVLEQALLVAIREVEDALTREQALFDEQTLLHSEIAIALDTVDNAKLRYINGQESFLAVLVALAKLQTLQQADIRLQQDLLINRGRLLKALGAKWSHHRETP
ncbi:MAG: TolC family protein [Thermodesulfobacteriota bacterium]|nr:TolC family protein [Thermodesulfobacteriota bacterium]